MSSFERARVASVSSATTGQHCRRRWPPASWPSGWELLGLNPAHVTEQLIQVPGASVDSVRLQSAGDKSSGQTGLVAVTRPVIGDRIDRMRPLGFAIESPNGPLQPTYRPLDDPLFAGIPTPQAAMRAAGVGAPARRRTAA